MPGRLGLTELVRPATRGILACLLVVIACVVVTPATPAAAASGPSGVQARGAELASATTGAVLWSRAADTKRPMGSITKVMTALVVIEAGHLGREIRIPSSVLAYVRKYDASTAGLIPGDVLTARELLYALLIPSGCDAAYVLASVYARTRTAFVATMNATAHRLGLGRIHFANFDGLPWPTEYSTYATPRDLVILGRDAMKLALFRQIVTLRRYHLAAGSGHHAYTWGTTNPLIGVYAGVIGIKTGSTAAAGYCLLFEAVRGGTALIGVVLDDSSMSGAGADAKRLLNWGLRR